MSEPLPWAAEVIAAAKGEDIPAYGSPEFDALPLKSWARSASIAIAAESWRTYWLPEEQALRLRLELDERARIDAAEADLDETWTPTLTLTERESYAAGRPSFAELSDRRGEQEKATSARLRAQQWREVA
ncbi:hypothetical protein ACI798_01410 [Geodermatophilus sp. SYSU D01045]